MQPNKFPQWPQQAQARGADDPLAQTAFSGEARLRELQHLADTARKVRDQAAAELTRSGSAHHIARDRIAAAERMLAKTQREIAELRAQMGVLPAKPKAATATAKPQDFELAMLLGHSKARFNRDEQALTGFQIQQDKAPERAPSAAPRGKRGAAAPRVQSRGRVHQRTKAHSGHGRLVAIGLFIALGIGLGAAGTYVMVDNGYSVPQAAETVRDGASQVVARIKTLVPAETAPAVIPPDKSTALPPPAPAATAVGTIEPRPAGTAPATAAVVPRKASVDPFTRRALEAQEQKLREEAARRLAERLARAEAVQPAISTAADEVPADSPLSLPAAPVAQMEDSDLLPAPQAESTEAGVPTPGL